MAKRKRQKLSPPPAPAAPSLPVPMPLIATRIDPSTLGTVDCRTIARCSDGFDYAIKDGAAHKLIPHAEWFCTCLADLLGIASPVCKLVRMPNGDEVFGSRWEGGTLAPKPAPQWYDLLLQKKINLSDVTPVLTRIYTFDHFIHNYDRHGLNFLARGQRIDPASGQLQFGLLAFDYSRAWVRNGFPLPALPFNPADPDEGTVRFQRQLANLVGNYIDPQEAKNFISEILKINSKNIEQIIRGHPNKWLPAKTRRAIVKWWGSADMRRRLEGIEKGIANGTYL